MPARHKQSRSSNRGGDPDQPIPAKQLRFLLALTEGDGPGKPPIPASEAAIRAGYPRASASEQASWILGRPNVKKWMAEHTAKLAAKHSITMDKIVDELAKIGFSNIGNYLRPDARGMPAFKKLDEIDRDHLAALSEITVDTRQEFDGRGEDREQTATVDKVKFKLNNKVESLVTLARVLGFMPTSTRGSGADDDTPDDGRKVIIEVRQTAMPVPRRRTDYKDDD